MGPLGTLPRLSRSSRRALWATGLLATGNAIALIVQAWALASALATVVTTSSTEITGTLVILAGAVVARAALGWALETVSARASAGAKEELRAALLDAAERGGPEWIHRKGAAQLTTLATNGLDALDNYFTKYLPALVTAVVVPPMVGAWILLSDWVSAVAVVCTIPLIPLFAWLVGKFTEQRTARAADAGLRLSGHLLELVRALPVLTAFGRARAQSHVVRRVGEAYRRATGATLRVAFLSALVLELFSSLSVALVAVGIGLRLVSGDLDLATGLLVLILVPECYLPLRAAGAAHHASEDGVEAVRRVQEAVDEVPGTDSAAGHHLPAPGSTLRVNGLSVVRRDGYAPNGLRFTAEPGHIRRLDGFDGIGPSGSGKTTTFAALLGFVRPDAGSITYGDHDVRELNIDEWRRLLAWVPQRPVFSGGTVADELAIALADQDFPEGSEFTATVGLDEIASTHLAHRRIDELSTGERQRVAVARALARTYGRARVLLLDEPTAHLDPANASAVDAAVRRAAERGITVVLASHRPGADDAEPAEVSTTDSEVLPESTQPVQRIRALREPRLLWGGAVGALSLLSGVALLAVSAWLIARASQQPPVLTLTVAAVSVRLFALSRAALRYIERLVTHDAAFRLAGRLREQLWDALVHLGPARSSAFRRGSGLARLVDDVDTIRDLVPRVLTPPLVAAAVLTGAVAVQTAVLPQAGLALAGALAAGAIAAPVLAVVTERRASTAIDTGRRRVAARVLALLDGSAELVAFGAHSSRRAELAAEDAHLARRSRSASFGAGAASAAGTLATGIGVIASTWLAAHSVAAGQIAPQLAAVLALVPLAAGEALALLPPAAQQWRNLRHAENRIAPLLARAPVPAQPTPATGTGDLILTDVDARWPGSTRPTLRSATMRVPRGTHVAIIGPSGSAKSTLFATLLGFLPVERGHMSLPVERGHMSLPVERGHMHRPGRIAWCPQQPHLVSTTIRENLRVAAPHASDTQLTEAMDLAGLPGWQHRLDDHVGSDGSALSGGEAQRLALARALLVDDAELILLDEPTAHLDEPTAEALLNRLRSALNDRTVLHITHRTSETAHADMVLHIEDVTTQPDPHTPTPRNAETVAMSTWE